MNLIFGTELKKISASSEVESFPLSIDKSCEHKSVVTDVTNSKLEKTTDSFELSKSFLFTARRCKGSWKTDLTMFKLLRYDCSELMI